MDNKESRALRGLRRGRAPLLPTSLLSFPVLHVDRQGTIVESNGVLERELGLPSAPTSSRRLLDLLVPAEREQLPWLANPHVPAPDRVRLRFSGRRGERAVYLFQVVRDSRETWLVGERRSGEAEDEAFAHGVARIGRQAHAGARVGAQLTDAKLSESHGRPVRDDATTKSRFLTTMSHELRTPLNAILGYAGLLRDGVYGPVSAQQQRAVQAITRRARDLQELIDDVLDLARLESGRMQLRPVEFDPAEVVDEVRDAMARLVEQKELRVATWYDISGPVLLDRMKYKQIVMNLVSNAVKFTPKRGEIEVSVESNGQDEFSTRVRDTGIGIASQDLQLIFDSFRQLETGPTRRYAGLGLGLATVNRLVELMHGRIALQSELGRGTAFTVTLPARGVQRAAGVDTDTLPPLAPDAAEPIVLVIDDDPEVIGLLRDSLAPEHYRVVGALRGARGLELARILRPFAITLDIMMPDKDGWQVLREIKSDPLTRDIPVIALSIVSEPSLGLSLGAVDYLVKPVERQELLAVLARLREHRALRTALVAAEDQDTSTLMRDLLGSLGFDARVSVDADHTIEQLAAQAPDLLFLDSTMADEDASRVVEAVTTDPRCEGTRLLAVLHDDTDQRSADRLRPAASAVIRMQTGAPDDLLRELRHALAAVSPSQASAAPTANAS